MFSTQYLSANDLQPVAFAIILGSLDFAGTWIGRRWFLGCMRSGKLGPQAS